MTVLLLAMGCRGDPPCDADTGDDVGCLAAGQDCADAPDGLACVGNTLWQCTPAGWRTTGQSAIDLTATSGSAAVVTECYCEAPVGLLCYSGDS